MKIPFIAIALLALFVCSGCDSGEGASTASLEYVDGAKIWIVGTERKAQNFNSREGLDLEHNRFFSVGSVELDDSPALLSLDQLRLASLVAGLSSLAETIYTTVESDSVGDVREDKLSSALVSGDLSIETAIYRMEGFKEGAYTTLECNQKSKLKIRGESVVFVNSSWDDGTSKLEVHLANGVNLQTIIDTLKERGVLVKVVAERVSVSGIIDSKLKEVLDNSAMSSLDVACKIAAQKGIKLVLSCCASYDITRIKSAIGEKENL